MNELTTQTDVAIQVFPAGMTGKKLRKKLGIDRSKDRTYGSKNFKVSAKFRGVKVKDRISFLRGQATVVRGARTYAEVATQRAGFDQHKLTALPMTEKCVCYACVKNTAVLRHHVITLLNGGRNKRNNIVPLCNQCHIKIHPHMNRKKSEVVASRDCVQPKINGPLDYMKNMTARVVVVPARSRTHTS